MKRIALIHKRSRSNSSRVMGSPPMIFVSFFPAAAPFCAATEGEAERVTSVKHSRRNHLTGISKLPGGRRRRILAAEPLLAR